MSSITRLWQNVVFAAVSDSVLFLGRKIRGKVAEWAVRYGRGSSCLILKSSFQNDELDFDHQLPYRVIGNSMILRAVYQPLIALIKVSRLPPFKSAPQSACILLADSWMHDIS